MIGVEQWRASIGLYHPGSHRQLADVPSGIQLTPIPIYHLVAITVLLLILADLLVHGIPFSIRIFVNGYSLLKDRLTRIMASKKRSNGTQLLVSVCAIELAVTEAHSGSLERSVRAMAILLIMAGDVEENPGPLPPASASPESRALRYHSASLVSAIADPLRLSWKLFSTGLIEEVTKDRTNLQMMTVKEKNDVLLSAVMSRVDADPSLFHRFVVLLKEDDDDILKSLGGKLEDTYTEFTKGDTERCTRNPPPAKQPELLPSHIRTQPSQPPPQPSYSHPPPSQPPSIPNLEPYNFEEFQMHLPHTQPLPLHPHPSQPLPHPSQSLPQPYTTSPNPSTLPHPGLDTYNIPFPSHPPPTLHGYYSMYCYPSLMHPHIPHSSTTHPPPPPPIKQAQHSPPPPPPALQSFLLFVSFLKAFYNSELPPSYAKWPPVPRRKYINLAAIRREKVSSQELKQFMMATLHGDVDEILESKVPITIQAILDTNQGEILHIVLVEGAPGVGKTTLSWEICKQWGREELFQQYTAVLLLKLRDKTVQNAKNIIDLIQFMHNDENESLSISQHMRQTKGKDTLIILDGLDELPNHLLNTDQPSIFTHLLSHTILPDATVLVTSRPSATVQLLTGWKISRHIEILGFTDKDITDYIHNALSHQELSAFDSYLFTYPNIRLMMYIPVNCAIVVEVYRSCQHSGHPPPKTTTELYTYLVQHILIRYLDSHSDYQDDVIDVNRFTDLPPPVYQHFYKLIQMAYDGVQRQQLIFHDQQKTIEHLGLMDSVTELFNTKHLVTYSYNFLHLSLQEYLGAYYISLQSVDEQQQLLQSTCTEQHLRNMGRFLAGITKYQGMDRTLVKAIIEHDCEKERDGSLTLSPNTLQLLHESGYYSIIDGHQSYSCKLTDYNPLLHFAVLGHCIANSSYKWTLRLGDFGQYMQSTNRVAMFVQTLNSHCNPSYTIKKITCWYDSPECVLHLLLELPQHALQHIQALQLVSNFDNPHPIPLPLLEHILSRMSRLHTLWLHYGAVSTTGAVAMAELIKNNNTLRKVDLVRNNIGAEGIEALMKIREIKKDLVLFIV